MALALGSMVIQSIFTGALDGNLIGDFGYITGGSTGAWSVLWHKGPFVASMADAALIELALPFVLGDLLGRKVIPTRSVDPAMAGTVVLQTAADVILVSSPLGLWVSTVANVRTI